MKLLDKLPAPLEIVIGGVIVSIPPFPDPTDIAGAVLITDGIRRLRRKGKTKKFNGKKYALLHRTKSKKKAYELKEKLKKRNYVRITKKSSYYLIWVRKR